MNRILTEKEHFLLGALFYACGAYDSRKICLDVDFPQKAITPRGTLVKNSLPGLAFTHVCCCHIIGERTSYEIEAQIFQKQGRTLHPIRDLNELVDISVNRLYFRLLAHDPAKPDVKIEVAQFKVDEIEEENGKILLYTNLSDIDLLE